MLTTTWLRRLAVATFLLWLISAGLVTGWGDDPPIPSLLDDALWAATLFSTLVLVLFCFAVFARRFAEARANRP